MSDTATQNVDGKRPADYAENGFAGAAPTELFGRKLQEFGVARIRADEFIEGPPDVDGVDPERFSSRTEVDVAYRRGQLDYDTYSLYCYGEIPGESVHPPKTFRSYFSELVPESCPLCEEELDQIVGSHIHFEGSDSYGVIHCPHCRRIYGEY